MLRGTPPTPCPPTDTLGARSGQHDLRTGVPPPVLLADSVLCRLTPAPHPPGTSSGLSPHCSAADGGPGVWGCAEPCMSAKQPCIHSAGRPFQEARYVYHLPTGCRTSGWCSPPGPHSLPRTPGCSRRSSSPGPASTGSTSPTRNKCTRTGGLRAFPSPHRPGPASDTGLTRQVAANWSRAALSL